MFSTKEIFSGIKTFSVYINYKAAHNKNTFLAKLTFEELRRLSEFRNGLITQEIGAFLKDNPDYNSKPSINLCRKFRIEQDFHNSLQLSYLQPTILQVPLDF